MKFIKVRAAGMFTPQEKGACKLTLIIDEDKTEEQNYAFTRLRYQDVVIGLAEAQDSPADPARDLTPDEMITVALLDIQTATDHIKIAQRRKTEAAEANQYEYIEPTMRLCLDTPDQAEEAQL